MENKHEEYQDNMNPTEDYNLGDGIGGEEIYNKLEGKWHDIENAYRNRYANLTDEDVQYEDGRLVDMLDRIGSRRGVSRHEIRTEIENW